LLPVDLPEPPAFPDELNLVVGMAMRPRTISWKGAEKEDGDLDVTVLGPHELMRASLEWKILLTGPVHHASCTLVPSTSALFIFSARRLVQIVRHTYRVGLGALESLPEKRPTEESGDG